MPGRLVSTLGRRLLTQHGGTRQGRSHSRPSRSVRSVSRSLDSAEILAVGSELTTGSTRDTNGGYLAAQLTELGVRVLRMTDLPDDLGAVREALGQAIERAGLVVCTGGLGPTPDDLGAVKDALGQAIGRAGLVVCTGGLGPTPDDLTREAIAGALGLQPFVDKRLERWLRALFRRRGQAMPEANLKQAWLIEGASALTNGQGTAPGWWVERPDGGLILALPGPPVELMPMWREQVVGRLLERGIGSDRAARTLRLSGIGESALVELIGEELLRAANPQVATYARPDAVDVRISAVAADGRSAQAIVDETVEQLLPRVGEFVFAEDQEGWADALGRRLAGRRLATVELGTAGQLMGLLGTAPFLQYAQLLRAEVAEDHARQNLGLYAERVREMSGVHIGLAVSAREKGSDMEVEVAISSEEGTHVSQRQVFLTGEQGRRRAALAACSELWQWLARPETASLAPPGTSGRLH